MSEMLGNQYFMARKYSLAEPILESCLRKYPGNKSIRKKLIVCYTQTGNLDTALSSFLSLIKEDIEYIINTDPVEDDCPCPELIYDLENSGKQFVDLMLEYGKLGILWLYCDINKSIYYFKKALEINPSETKLKSIHVIIQNHIESRKGLTDTQEVPLPKQINGHYF